MKCDGCGCQLSAREASTNTKSEAVGPAYNTGQETKTVTMTLCPDCAASRAATQRFITWVVLAPLVAVLLMVLLGVGGSLFR